MTRDRLTSPPASSGHGWPLLALLAVGVALAVALVFIFADPFSSSEDADERASYTEAIVGVPSRVNPLFVHLSDVDRDIASLVFTGLVRLDKDGTPLPDLAEDWEVSDDGQTVTFNLRAGVLWHTNTPFTADDVVFTYELLADPALQGDAEQTALWQSIDCTAPDDLTVACELPEPYAPFLTYASAGILPKHILEAATAETIAQDPFNRAPVGTGPFRLVTLDDTHAALRANEDFYLGPPAIDELDLRFFPDIASAAAEMVRGEAQGLLVDLTINPDDFQTLRTLEGLEAHTAHRSAYTSLYLNNTETPLNDRDVREAIARVLDVDSIIASLLGGRAVRTVTPIVPDTWAYDGGADPPSHDIGEARSILSDAGWELPDGETVRQRNGTELRISLITDQDPLRGAVAQAIADQLGDIGMEASVVRQSSSDLVREFLIPRQYQAAIFGWDSGPEPDPYPAWHSSQALDNGRNLAGYTSDDADALMEEARRSNDIEERRELYGEYQELFLADVASIPLYAPQYTYLVSSEVRDVDLGVLFWTSSRFQNAYQWRLERSSTIGG